MARPLVSDALWADLAPLLPPPRPRPKGGWGGDTRPGRTHRHPVRAQVRHPLGDAAARDELRVGHDLLAAAVRLAQGRHLVTAAWRAARPAGPGQRHQLVALCLGQCCRDSQRRSEQTGPNPTDRGHPSTKRHLLVDAGGIPFALRLSPADRHDSRMLEAVLDAVPPVRQCRGCPRRRPAKLHADKAYVHAACRHACRVRKIVPRIARRGVECSERLAGIVGSSSASWPGSPASAASPSATNAAPTSARPSTTSPPPSSAPDSSNDGSVRCS